eukprot:Anaeramoba_ignava/a102954_7.p2 GENE.a102954_7~~a102954_7.p2  ORF type:complete len:107 (-),score=7.80 a102954_7:360-680(-)
MDFTENLFEIIKQNEDQVIIKLRDENHPIFKAHFPGFPILPGFLLIDIFAKIQKKKIKKIEFAKFINHTLPNDVIIYNIIKEDEKTKLKIVKDDEKKTKIAQIRCE